MAKPTSVNVLILDDDRAIQRLLADALTKQGFTVTVERDGEWAVRTFEKKSFDVVLLDLLLPTMSGYDVARRLRALPKGKKTPIIMISGVYKNALHQREAVQKHGAFAFLEKPIAFPLLFETLRDALGSRYPDAKPVKPAPPSASNDAADEKLAGPDAQEEVTNVEALVKRTPDTVNPVRGDLSTKPFPEVLAEVYRWRANGALLLRRDKVKKIVYLREGRPQSVKSNLLSECLGRVMVREKMISEAECEESLKRMKASGRQQGTVLVEMGCISPHNLVYALNLQVQSKLFDVFAWDNGDYQLNPDVKPPGDTVDLELTTAAVIYEGVRRRYTDERVQRRLGDCDGLFVHPSEHPLYALQDAGLGEEERTLLQTIDGHQKVSTLRALGLLPPADFARFLYAMRCSQMIELKEERAEGKPRLSIARMAESAPRPPPLPPPPPFGESRPTEAEPSLQGLPPPPKAAPPPAGKAAAGSLLPELSRLHAPGKPAGEEGLVRERLVQKVQALRKMNYFEVLGVAANAGREDIKRSYFALAKEYHPDKHFGSSSAEIRHLAGQIYELISTAHDTLTDPVERERYGKELAAGVKRDIGDEVGKILAAEGKFQRGEELLRKHHFKEAEELFHQAIALYDQEGEFHAFLGWTQFQQNPRDADLTDRALKSLERAMSLNPKSDKSYLFTGYIYKTTGRPDKAEKQFEKAIQCNPDCTEALRELRLLGKGRK